MKLKSTNIIWANYFEVERVDCHKLSCTFPWVHSHFMDYMFSSFIFHLQIIIANRNFVVGSSYGRCAVCIHVREQYCVICIVVENVKIAEVCTR